MRFSIHTGLMLLASLMLFIGLATSRAAGAATAPPRSSDDIYEYVDKIASQIGDLSIPSLVDPAKRAEATKYVPALRKLISLAGELSANPDPTVRVKGPAILSRYRAVLVTLDDAPTIADIEKQLHASDPHQAAAARSDLLYGRWIKASAEDQPKLADDASILARDNPGNDQLASALYSMTQIGHPALPTVIKLEDAVLQMKSKSAKDFAEQIQSIR